MRPLFCLVPLILYACAPEPTFDERYESAQGEIEEKAKLMDDELEGKPSPESENVSQSEEASE